MTKHSGQSAHEYFYAPYGGIIDDNGHPEDSSNWTNPHNHYLLTGKEWDEESRLYYFGARYYDAAVGVWLTQDMYRGQVEQPLTLHRTLYVAANPVNHVDAYGYRVIANGYGGSGGGSTPVSPQQPAPSNSARPDNSPYEWKIERDEERFESSGGGRDESEPGILTDPLHVGLNGPLISSPLEMPTIGYTDPLYFDNPGFSMKDYPAPKVMHLLLCMELKWDWIFPWDLRTSGGLCSAASEKQSGTPLPDPLSSWNPRSQNTIISLRERPWRLSERGCLRIAGKLVLPRAYFQICGPVPCRNP